MANNQQDLNNRMKSLNVNAMEFVPSWAPPPQGQPMTSVPPPNMSGPPPGMPPNAANNLSANNSPVHMPPPPANPPAPKEKVVAESWEDDDMTGSSAAATPSPAHQPKSEGADSATTPDDDEDNSMATDDGGESGGHYVPTSKPKTKKPKPEKAEATTTEKEHVNIVFIGHVDAGKSTIGGQIQKLTGMVDARTLEKYEREAKEKNRESWALSWCMDTNQEERDKGKTVEVGRAYFETQKKHFTILDAPGHKSFVPNMIGGASQADLAVLVISSRKGEFETGFERGGQTREHAMLVKTAGVRHLVVLVNKMDDPTVQWDKGRYDGIKDSLTPYLKKCGFNPAKDVKYIAVSGLTGAGILEPIPKDVCPWATDDAFIPYLDSLPSLKRNTDGPFMMPIADKYSDMGVVVMGKVESGECVKGQSLSIYPNKTSVKVDTLWSDDIEVTKVVCGENVKVKLKGSIEEADINPGFVLCNPENPIKSCKVFDAQVVVLDYPSIICAGKTFVMHLQALIEEVTLKALICLVDKKTGEKSKTRPRFIKQDQIAIVRFRSEDIICMEIFKDHPQLGRFTLRDEGKTVAIGKVLKLVE